MARGCAGSRLTAVLSDIEGRVQRGDYSGAVSAYRDAQPWLRRMLEGGQVGDVERRAVRRLWFLG